MTSFPTRLRYISANEPVSSAVANRTAQVLDARTNYLREAIAALESYGLLVFDDAPIAETALPGHAVYWNVTTQRFEPALARVDRNTETATLEAASSSDVLGMVLTKTGPTCGTIALQGIAKFASLSNAVDDVQPGRYYLSATEPGRLVRERPAVAVAVCYVLGSTSACDTQISVYVHPQARNFLEDHIHYQIDLVARPAGQHTPPMPGQAHVITDPDVSMQGWLPANHASFAGTAPAGATFGYNLAAHPELQAIWPPSPTSACVLEVYRRSIYSPVGEESVVVAGRALPEFVRFDAYGIWWMTDCYDQVPWPTDYDSSEGESSSEGVCPAPAMRLTLSFVKMTFATDKTVVTSLQPAAGQPIVFRNRNGQVATTGDLYASIDTSTSIASGEVYGGHVLKSVYGFTFGAGWVTEGIIAGSERVRLTGSRQRYLIPSNPSSDVVHQGLVSLDVDIDPADRELAPQIIKLGDALERYYKGVLYLGLPANRNSALRMMFLVPSAGLPTSPKMKLRVTLLPPLTGTLPALSLSYYRLSRPPAVLTEGDTSLAFDASVAVTADNILEVESPLFEIAPGDTVMVSLSRAADATPAYAADVGVLRVAGIVTKE